MKKEKKQSALKSKIQEMKQTTQGKALLKLIYWAIFFFVLLLFCLIASFFSSPSSTQNNSLGPQTTTKPSQEEPIIDQTLSLTTLNTVFSSLTSFNYTYEITLNDEIIRFNGTKTLETDTGYKESNSGIIKYYIDNTGIYQQTTTDKILIDNLYENINSEYLNITSIFNLYKTLTLNLSNNLNNSDLLYIASDNLNNYEIQLNNNTLSYLRIYNDTYNYYLTFTNIGGVS